MDEIQIERYSRNIILKEVGGKGQEKLLNSKVLIIGAGGLGAPAALYLAAAGVGTIGLADGDQVDLSNLQRQVIHFTDDVGTSKVDSAREKIERLNPDVRVISYKDRAVAHNITEMISGYDFIIDGTDNFLAKFLINDACVLAGKSFSHAGILGFTGQTITVVPQAGPCYRCLFIAPPPPGSVPSCSQAGVLGALAGVIGTLQAVEALKYLLGVGDLLVGRLLIFEALGAHFREVKLNRNEECPVCGKNRTITATPTDHEQGVCDSKR